MISKWWTAAGCVVVVILLACISLEVHLLTRDEALPRQQVPLYVTPAATTDAPRLAEPTKTRKPAPKVSTRKPRPKATTTHKPRRPKPSKPATVYYANCAAVRKAHADPIFRGEPGYSLKLDGDRDGKACDK